MNSSPLVPIWEAYLMTMESLRVSKRVVIFSKNATETLNALDGSEPVNRASDASVQYSTQVTDDLFVLSLWATLERYFIDFFQEKGEKIR
ncbi:hypothetical protein THIOM_001758 [Candidatus Thiomargarita nelsonii]|uniref:Uncharacterized protein n=1 Tax=Candidatus Thiomargarita nelsonii TaxID=1003181 RepID=A0A176S3C9_9GAMM|nr:hypothetical protein THIOM_001758 [Candidatus Thiomargarita nelsonii]